MNNDGAAGQIVPTLISTSSPVLPTTVSRHWIGKPYANKEEVAKIAEKIRSEI